MALVSAHSSNRGWAVPVWWCTDCKLKYRGSFGKQIQLVGKRFRLVIHQNTTNAYVFKESRWRQLSTQSRIRPLS